MNKFKVLLTVALAVMISVSAVFAVSMSVDELKQLTSGEQSFGAFPGGDIYTDVNVYSQMINVPQTITATTTLTGSAANIQLLPASASMETITLPAVAAKKGMTLRFQVTGALTGSSVLIDSAEGDNISGSLIVAGAVVACSGEDQINIITDGELPGDYVELFSDGTQWLLVDSGVTASGKMTCTDPS